ncbi:MAG TPA: RICIN domain-containing protein [Armatimonadota bacterium]
MLQRLRASMIGLVAAGLAAWIAMSSASAIVLQGQFGTHDPSRIIKCNGRYYVYATGANIQMRYSVDLVHWSNGQSVLAANDSANGVPQWARNASPGNTGNVCWAPDIVYFGGLYHLYWSFSTFGSPNSVIGLMTNPTLDPGDASYHWTDQGMIVQSSTSTAGPNCIDPAPVYDSGGNLWLVYGSYNGYGIGLTRLDNTTGLRLSPASAIYHLASSNIEASYILPHGSYYYLFYNAGTCCAGANSTYHIMMGRSASITGPYLDKAGKNLLSGGGTLFLASAGNKIGPGHMGVYNDGTIERFTYHLESDGTNYGASTLNLQTLLWGSDGWPVAGYELPGGTYKIISKSSGLALTVHDSGTADGAALDQSAYTGSAFQKWYVMNTVGGTPQTGLDGYCRITSAGSGKVVDLYNCNTGNGTAIDQYPWFNNNCQRWLIEQTTDGYWRLVSRGGGGAINVPDSSTLPGTLLNEWAWSGGDNQQWSFVAPDAPAAALAIAAGMSIVNRNNAATLDAVASGRVDLLDAVRLLRQSVGL